MWPRLDSLHERGEYHTPSRHVLEAFALAAAVLPIRTVFSNAGVPRERLQGINIAPESAFTGPPLLGNPTATFSGPLLLGNPAATFSGPLLLGNPSATDQVEAFNVFGQPRLPPSQEAIQQGRRRPIAKETPATRATRATGSTKATATPRSCGGGVQGFPVAPAEAAGGAGLRRSRSPWRGVQDFPEDPVAAAGGAVLQLVARLQRSRSPRRGTTDAWQAPQPWTARQSLDDAMESAITEAQAFVKEAAEVAAEATEAVEMAIAEEAGEEAAAEPAKAAKLAEEAAEPAAAAEAAGEGVRELRGGVWAGEVASAESAALHAWLLARGPQAQYVPSDSEEEDACKAETVAASRN